jgi:hypothetical protein
MELKMKSKFLVLAVMSTFSAAASAVDFNADNLVPGSVDISVVNSAFNIGTLDSSIDIEGSSVSISQTSDVIGIANADVHVDATGSADTLTVVDLKVENIGNKFSTSAIGAIVQSTSTINTGLNTTDGSADLALTVDELVVGDTFMLSGELGIGLGLSTVSVPEVLVANSAINTADLDASVTMNSHGNLDLQNISINTSAIGAAVVATTTLSVGLGID